MDVKELLITGFIHEMEELFNNKIVPVDIIQLCYLFYSNTLNIFLYDPSTKYFFIANRDYKKYAKIIANTDGKNDIIRIKSNPFCYIPNISSLINIQHNNMNKNTIYDGIIGITEEIDYDFDIYYPALLLFEANNISSNVDIEYLCYESIKMMSDLFTQLPNQFLFCGEKHGVIYENNGALYQLKLNEIKNYNFCFNKMIQNKNHFADDSTHRLVMDVTYLSIGYLVKKEMIFAMRNDVIYKMQTKSSQKCGIFDLNKYEWKQIKSFQYNHNFGIKGFFCGICKDNDFNLSQIYIVSNIGHTAQYDMYKNEWITIYQDLDQKCVQFECNKQPTVWLDDNPHILYCSGFSIYDDLSAKIACLDIRDRNKKWCKYVDLDFPISNKYNVNHSIFL